MFARFVSAVAGLLVALEGEGVTPSLCFRCADVFGAELGHECPASYWSGVCEDCNALRRLDTAAHRCLTCGSLSTKPQQWHRLNEEMN